jgi:diketogulonate reductase-like aldo/keto reductase
MAFERVTLGRTGLSVTRLGIAASYGTDEAMIEAAVERGVNYLWWGALRTKKMARGIRAVARNGREDLVIVLHAVTRKPAAIATLVEDSLSRLGVDYIDVLPPRSRRWWRTRCPGSVWTISTCCSWPATAASPIPG